MPEPSYYKRVRELCEINPHKMGNYFRLWNGATQILKYESGDTFPSKDRQLIYLLLGNILQARSHLENGEPEKACDLLTEILPH